MARRYSHVPSVDSPLNGPVSDAPLQKYFLQQILCVLGGAGHSEDQAEEAPGMLAIQPRTLLASPDRQRSTSSRSAVLTSPGTLDGKWGRPGCRPERFL